MLVYGSPDPRAPMTSSFEQVLADAEGADPMAIPIMPPATINAVNDENAAFLTFQLIGI
jgi:hypothetical protein